MNRNIRAQHDASSGRRWCAARGIIAVFAAVFLAGVTPAGSAGAQTRATGGEARIAVQAVMAVHTVGAPREIAREQGRLSASSDVVVDANTRYMLRVRLAHQPLPGVHVFVRDTAGVFQPLVGNDGIVVAVEQQRGRTAHTVGCRIEAPDPALIEVGACALTYDWFSVDGGLRLLSVSIN